MRENNLSNVLKKLYKLLDRRQKIRFIAIILIMMISAALAQMTPKAIGWLTDDILSKNSISFTKVIPFLVFILIVNVVNEIIKIVRRVLVEDTATRTEKKAKGMVIKSLLMAPLSYFRKNMTGNIHGRLNRCLDGTIKLEKLLFMDLAPAVFNSIAAIVTIFITLPATIAFPMLLVMPIGVLIVLKQIKSQKGIRVELLNSKAEMDGTIVELMNGIEVIRICDSLDFETARFDGKSEFLRAKEMKHHKAMALYDCLKFVNQAVFTVFVIGISTYLATKSVISVGSVLTAYLCFNQLLKPLEELHRIFDEVSECTVLATDFFKMTEIEHDFSYSPSAPVEQHRTSGEMISMDNVTFSYPENEDKVILDDFSIGVENGAYLGVAGPSGCGKSSLIKAICRLEKTGGTITIDGAELSSLSRKAIAGLVALVPQTPFLIAGTIRENITYGLDREVSDAEVEAAAKRAYIYDYIDSLPGRFETTVSESGGNLSGGQRQRIAIARIFLRRPKILILDEATSALDNTSEKHIQAEIEKMQAEDGTTVIAIAHRLTTLKSCDRIIVLNGGKIAEDGKFDELIELGGMFSDMYYGRMS